MRRANAARTRRAARRAASRAAPARRLGVTPAPRPPLRDVPQLYDQMAKITPLPSVYFPEFIAANQSARAEGPSSWHAPTSPSSTPTADA